jgi:NAD+ synthase
MNRIENYFELETSIVTWIQNYVIQNNIKALVVGVSGGIDSAVVSTLCAETGYPTYVLSMPLHSSVDNDILSDNHCKYLEKTYSNVTKIRVELSSVYDKFLHSLDWWSDAIGQEKGTFTTNRLANANTKSRIRMVTLYQIAGSVGGIVVGTGNKVEDYGVGFYTKYGDGGVDIAPIADLYKTEVWELGRHLGVDQRIIDAPPTDGLWEDSRTDETQIGTSYELLEWVMESEIFDNCSDPESLDTWKGQVLTDEQKNAIKQYKKFNTQNQHKMNSIPTFKL